MKGHEWGLQAKDLFTTASLGYTIKLIDKTAYGDYTALKQQLRRFLDEVYTYKRIHSTLD